MSAFYEDIVKFVANNLKCSICFNMFTKPVTLACGHNYCRKCISEYWASSSAKNICPQCRTYIRNCELEINFTLCDILELQELGGRDRWEQILAEIDQDYKQDGGTKVEILMKRQKRLQDEIKNTEDALSAELTNSETSCAERSFSQTSGNHQEHHSQYSIEESTLGFAEDSAENSDSQFEDFHFISSAGVQQCNGDSATAAHNAEFVELTFSPEMGNKHLFFHSELRRMETRLGPQVRTSHGRFSACQWMADQEFSRGRFYWDVDTSFATGWAVGVASPSLMCNERLGGTSSSWCLEWSSKQLSAWHNNVKTTVKQHTVPNGIRVILDMTKGQLRFQSLNEDLELHSFQVNFSDPLRPVFWLFGLSQNALIFLRH